MKKPAIPACEAERLQALKSLDLLDTEPEVAYDSLTAIVKEFFGVPIVAISLIDSERQWFKSIQGLDVCETSREVSFCAHTILQDSVFLVENTLKSPDFKDNPLVTADPNIRFYAGYPLKSPEGYSIGSLCIIDTQPRVFTQSKLDYLKRFALLLDEEFLEKRKSTGYLREIAKIQEMYISGEPSKPLFNYILTFLLRHTGSEYGFIGTVLKTPKTNVPFLKTYAVTNISWNEETRRFYNENAPQGLEFKNLETLFRHTLKTGEQVISNNPLLDWRSGSLPAGCPPMSAYLGIPIFGKEGFIAMYGLANRKGGYDEKTISDLAAITHIMTSIIESSRNLATVEDMAKKDALTGAYNRFYLESYVTEKLSHLDEATKHCFLMIDFDSFKKINDYYGHPEGDKVLMEFVKRLKPILKRKDFVARIGGDEFLVFLENLREYGDAESIAERIIALSRQPYKIADKNIVCSVSIGIASYPFSAKSYDALIRNTDLALYKAKQEKSGFVFYSQALNTAFKEKIEIENKLRKALAEKVFYCVYQPQIDLNTNKIIGVEALLRWNNDYSPDKFIPIIESMNLSRELNKYIINIIMSDLEKMPVLSETFKVAINISLEGHSFKHHMLELSDFLISSQPPKKIAFEFEITEGSFLFSNTNNNMEVHELSLALKARGISLAIDDFGIKQSSINRLIEGNFSTIKIDKSFVDKLSSSQSNEAIAIIRAVVTLAKDLGLQVIAEGVETEAQLEALRKLDVHCIQGYIFSKPLSMDKFCQLLAKPFK
jgi:diguanylate cyclase